MKKCADPKLCYTKWGSTGKATRILRHYSLSSPVFKLLAQDVFDCGTCAFCRKKRATELAVRCVLNASLYKQNCFLTLTYDESKPGYHNNFQYEDIQQFKKKLRSHCEYHYEKKIKIFNVHEYGKRGKKHWHLVVFGHNFDDRRPFSRNNGNPLSTSPRLEKLWPHGFSTIGDVTEASAMYQAQYTQKDIKNGNSNNDKKSHSRHSGIGRDYFLQHYEQILSLGFIPFGGKKIPIPRYFQKLAHKHWAHFNDQSYFYDIPGRKRVYRPFDEGQANQRISHLFTQFSFGKSERIKAMSEEWDTFVAENLFSREKPDFLIAAENYLYDLSNKQHLEGF